MTDVFEEFSKETIRRILQPLVLGGLKSANSDHPGCIDLNLYSSIVKRIVATLTTQGGVQKMREVLAIIDRGTKDAA
jgi:hypothetical protein